MKRTSLSRLRPVAAACLMVSSLVLFRASNARGEANHGFVQRAVPLATGEERNRQPDLWVLEMEFKQVRLVSVEITDPQTGAKHQELVWYLPYRVINRPIEIRKDESDLTPVNELDPTPTQHRFIPEFLLVTYDDPKTEIPAAIHLDMILPEALQAINRKERRSPSDPVFLDSVSVIREIPKAVPANAVDQPWIYGVATWKNVDPQTDFFKVIVRGLSNAYEVKTAENGTSEVWRKILVQRFQRRGDEFDQTQREFEFAGQPQWDYQPAGGTAAAQAASATPAPEASPQPTATEEPAAPTEPAATEEPAPDAADSGT